MAGLCDPDPHGGPDGTYVVDSLYLDGPELPLFWANEREAGRRVKARVRSYPSLTDRVFLELKFRDGDVIRKTRGRVARQDWHEAMRAPGTDAEVQRFAALVDRRNLRPVVAVRYRREAWISRWDDYARISVDRTVACKPARGHDLVPDGAWRPVDHPVWTQTVQSVCVLELKWAEVAPRWMAELVGRLELNRASFSKYCHSMRTLGEAHRVDVRRSTARVAS